MKKLLNFIKTNKLLAIFVAVMILFVTGCSTLDVVSETPSDITTASSSNDFSEVSELSSKDSNNDISTSNSEPTHSELATSSTLNSEEEVNSTPSKPSDESTPTHQHTYTTKTVEPTCTKGGYTLHTCSCGKSYKDNTVSQRGHLYGDWEVTKKATTTSTGQKECTCSRCGNVTTQEIAKLSGSYKNIDSAIIIENTYSGGKPATRYKLEGGSVRVLDKRSWGEAPSITVTSSGGLHAVYYDKANNKVEFTVEPIEGHINRFTILDDGTYVTMVTGSYS